MDRTFRSHSDGLLHLGLLGILTASKQLLNLDTVDGVGNPGEDGHYFFLDT